MRYQTHEGSFEVPDDFIDRSINILAAPGNSGISVVMSRDKLQQEENLESFLTRQLRDLANQVSQFREVARKPVSLGSARQPGICIGTEYKQHGKSLYQRQAVFVLNDGPKVLIFTLSSPQAFTDTQDASWVDLLAKFQPR